MDLCYSSSFNTLTLNETIETNGGASVYDLIYGTLYSLGLAVTGFVIAGTGVAVGLCLAFSGVYLGFWTVKVIVK